MLENEENNQDPVNQESETETENPTTETPENPNPSENESGKQGNSLADRLSEQTEYVPEPDPEAKADKAGNGESGESEEGGESSGKQVYAGDWKVHQGGLSEKGPKQTQEQKFKGSRNLIKTMDKGQNALFTWLYRKAYFTDKEWEQLQENLKKGYQDLEDTAEIALRDRYNAYLREVEGLPFTDEEINELTEAFQEMMDYLQKQPPNPVMGFIIVALTTLAPRGFTLLVQANIPDLVQSNLTVHE